MSFGNRSEKTRVKVFRDLPFFHIAVGLPTNLWITNE